VRGRTYRLVASGAITQSKTDVTGRTVTYQLDPLYCFQTTDPAFGGNCSAAVPVYSPRFQLTLPPSTVPASSFDVATPGPSRPPFSPQHRYAVTFRATAGGPVYARTAPVPSVQEDSYAGSYRLDVYGEAPRKKKRTRKRKRRQVGCPARRSSTAPARAAAGCHWVVDFFVRQRGEPNLSFPDPPFALLETETVAVGKVFFNAEPRRGRVSSGSASALVVHTDTYESPVIPLAQDEGGLTMKARRGDPARYEIRRGSIELKLPVRVTDVSGVDYESEDPDRGGLVAQMDFPFHRDDSLLFSVGCTTARCARIRPNAHAHRYTVDSQNRLRVDISRPRPLR
jgi:hypothetical protein